MRLFIVGLACALNRALTSIYLFVDRFAHEVGSTLAIFAHGINAAERPR